MKFALISRLLLKITCIFIIFLNIQNNYLPLCNADAKTIKTISENLFDKIIYFGADCSR